MMSKERIAFFVEDMSGFARALARQLDEPPGHLALLNMLARAGGFKNYQHLRKVAEAGLPAAAEAAPRPMNEVTLAKALRLFDGAGQLTLWHKKRSVQDLCTWALWAGLPQATIMSEREISAVLNGLHSFGDAAVIRRRMVTLGLVVRTDDGSEYRRVEQAPPEEARVLIRRMKGR